jgi:GNAT acetyltransferase-like protein
MNHSSLLWWLYEHAPPQAEDAGKLGLACLTCYRQRRVPVSLLRGPTRTGAPATVLAAGHVDYLTQHIFAAPPAREVVGKFPWWTLRRHLQSWHDRANLTLANVPRVVASRIAGREYLVVPEWVSMWLPVPRDVQELSRTSGSLRDDLRIMRRNGLSHTVEPPLADIDRFYEQMYVPFVRQRHGATAFVRSLRHLRALSRRGGIVWIERAGQRIAGLSFQRRGRRLRMLSIGTLNGDYSLVKVGAMAALYVAALEYARTHGCSVVDSGGTRASLTDGVFRYKRKWGGAITPNSECFSAFLVHWGRWNHVVAEFLARTGLVFTDGPSFDAVRVVGDGQPAGHAFHECWTAGLRRLYLINPAGWPAADPPPHTILVSPSTDATLGSSQLTR